MFKIRSRSRSVAPVEELQTQITELEQRTLQLERALNDNTHRLERAVARRHQLLEASSIDFDGAELAAVNTSIREAKGRIADLHDAIVAVGKRKSEVEGSLSDLRDQQIRRLEIDRVNTLLANAQKAAKQLHDDLLAFNTAVRQLGAGGEWCAISAEQFRTAITMQANDVLLATAQYRDRVANGEPLSSAVKAAHALQTNGSK